MTQNEQNIQLIDQNRELSPRQVARAIGVSESSLKRWCDRGAVPMRKTAGGHRKIPIAGVVRFVRDNGHPLIRPELLGLPGEVGTAPESDDEAVTELVAALAAGDGGVSRRLLFGIYLTGRSLAAIFDTVLKPAFHEIGRAWHRGELEVYREHRAVEIIMRLLRELRSLSPDPAPNAPVAIGATLEGDPYSMAIQMAELVLLDRGWRAESLGPSHPAHTLVAALEDVRPQLLWLSASHLDDRPKFLRDYRSIYNAARDRGIAVVVGGQSLDAELRAQMRYTAFCETMRDLVGLADGLGSQS